LWDHRAEPSWGPAWVLPVGDTREETDLEVTPWRDTVRVPLVRTPLEEPRGCPACRTPMGGTLLGTLMWAPSETPCENVEGNPWCKPVESTSGSPVEVTP
jgi:hypothetical protein